MRFPTEIGGISRPTLPSYHPSQVRYPTEMAGISCVPPDQYADRFGDCLDTWISSEPPQP